MNGNLIFILKYEDFSKFYTYQLMLQSKLYVECKLLPKYNLYLSYLGITNPILLRGNIIDLINLIDAEKRKNERII